YPAQKQKTEEKGNCEHKAVPADTNRPQAKKFGVYVPMKVFCAG
ncbi:unnamed protein product, partial [marine sediment metagenome]